MGQRHYKIWQFFVAIMLAGSFAVAIALSVSANEGSCLKVAFSHKSMLNKAQKVVLERIYQQAGFCLIAMDIPNNRAHDLLSRGKIDGDAFGAGENIDKNKRLVKVPEPLLIDSGLVVVRKRQNIDSWSDLEGLSVGVQRGTRWEQSARKKPGINVVTVSDRKQLFELLNQQRVSAIVIRKIHMAILRDIEKVDLSHLEIAFDLGNVEFFHSLALKHSNLSVILADSIRSLKKENAIPSLTQEWVNLISEK